MRCRKRQGSRTPHCPLQGDRLPPRRAAVVFTAAETCVVLLVGLGHLTLQRAARLRSCCALEGSPHSDGDDDKATWTSRLDHWVGGLWASRRELLEPLPLSRLPALAS